MPEGARDALVELRRYRLVPGRRDELVELFDRELVEPQEELGAHVIGTFRDLDDPDRFVWLRGFPDEPTRTAALEGFYGGPVWKQHREAANATMVDSDDVSLLRPVRAHSGLPVAPPRPAPGGDPGAGRLVTATQYRLSPGSDEDAFVRRLEDAALPVLEDTGAPTLGYLWTAPVPNGFPALPVHEDERIVVVLSAFADAAEHAAHHDRLAASPAWTGSVRPTLDAYLDAEPVELRLAPTARSELR